MYASNIINVGSIRDLFTDLMVSVLSAAKYIDKNPSDMIKPLKHNSSQIYFKSFFVSLKELVITIRPSNKAMLI